MFVFAGATLDGFPELYGPRLLRHRDSIIDFSFFFSFLLSRFLLLALALALLLLPLPILLLLHVLLACFRLLHLPSCAGNGNGQARACKATRFA